MSRKNSQAKGEGIRSNTKKEETQTKKTYVLVGDYTGKHPYFLLEILRRQLTICYVCGHALARMLFMDEPRLIIHCAHCNWLLDLALVKNET